MSSKVICTALAVQVQVLHNISRNLYLRVRSATDRCFILPFSRAGNRRDMMLGALRNMTIEQAEAIAAEYRELLEHGLDPIEERKGARQRAPRHDVASRLDNLEQNVERLNRELAALRASLTGQRYSVATIAPDPDPAVSRTSNDQSLVDDYIAATVAEGRLPRKIECQAQTGLSYPRVTACWPKNLPDARGRRRTTSLARS
jgi:hypothetical protein